LRVVTPLWCEIGALGWEVRGVEFCNYVGAVVGENRF
jgi:hypothetical protein